MISWEYCFFSLSYVTLVQMKSWIYCSFPSGERVLAIVGAVAAIAGIAYAVYKFFTPDYLEDFEEDFEDDFDDDFFSDDDEV